MAYYAIKQMDWGGGGVGLWTFFLDMSQARGQTHTKGTV